MKIIQYIKQEHYEAIVYEDRIFEREFDSVTGDWSDWKRKEIPKPDYAIVYSNAMPGGGIGKP